MPQTGRKTIRELREAQGMTLAQLAHNAYVDPDILERVERGTMTTPLIELRRIAPALGVTVDDIALREQERLINVRGYRFHLEAHYRGADGWLARVIGDDSSDATDWPKRAPNPDYPDDLSPGAISHRNPETGIGWEEVGATAGEAINKLASRVTAAMERAMIPHRQPDDPEDWTSPDAPDYWPDHLAGQRKRAQRRSR